MLWLTEYHFQLSILYLKYYTDLFLFFPSLFGNSILISAFGGTALAFGCFSAAAMLAKRREYLYLGGLLSSGVSILLWLRFASAIFGGSASLFEFEVLSHHLLM